MRRTYQPLNTSIHIFADICAALARRCTNNDRTDSRPFTRMSERYRHSLHRHTCVKDVASLTENGTSSTRANVYSWVSVCQCAFS
jgi:hypothetical protein